MIADWDKKDVAVGLPFKNNSIIRIDGNWPDAFKIAMQFMQAQRRMERIGFKNFFFFYGDINQVFGQFF